MLLVSLSCPVLLAPSSYSSLSLFCFIFCSNLNLVSPSFPFSIPVSLPYCFPFSLYENCFPLFCSSFWIPTSFLLFTPVCHPLPLVSPNSRDQQFIPSPLLGLCHPPPHIPLPAQALKSQLFVQPFIWLRSQFEIFPYGPKLSLFLPSFPGPALLWSAFKWDGL